MNWSKPRSTPVTCLFPLSLMDSLLSMYFFKSGPVAAGMGTEGDEGSPVLRVAEEIVSAGRERRADSGGAPSPRLAHVLG